MKLRCVGDCIVTDDGTVVAVFAPRLLPTIREKAEELLMHGAVENDWELRERLFEYEGKLEELDGEIAGLRDRIREIEGVE